MGKVIADGSRLDVLEHADVLQRQSSGNSRAQRRLTVLLLLLVDCIAVASGYVIAQQFAEAFLGIFPDTFLAGMGPQLLLVLGAFIGIFWAYGLYNSSILPSGGSDYRAVGNANALGLVGTILLSGLFTGWALDVRALILFWFTTTCACLVGRFAMRRFIYVQRNRGRAVERTLILGANSEGVAIANQLLQSRKSGSTVVAFLDDFKPIGDEPAPGIPIVGKLDELETLIKQERIDSVLIASPKLLKEFFSREERGLEILSQVEVQMAWGGFELLTTGVRIKEEGSVPLVVLDKTRIRGVHLVLKTILDYVIATVALVLLFPLFAVLMILVKLDSKGPAIHRRGVVGVGGKRFDAYKFRTMHVNGDEMLTAEMKEEWRVHGKIKDDPRITRMGAFIRKFSLDELPQLMNVLRGEMSLVGPRMITPAELAHFGKWHHSRGMVKPGMTGLWQISGRSDLNYEDRARLDIYYIRNHSVWMDVRILVMTLPAVIFGRGAY